VDVPDGRALTRISAVPAGDTFWPEIAVSPNRPETIDFPAGIRESHFVTGATQNGPDRQNQVIQNQ
jgi:hypothetical protein